MSLEIELGYVVDSSTVINNLGGFVTAYCKYYINDEAVYIEKYDYIDDENTPVTLAELTELYNDALEILLVVDYGLNGFVLRCGNGGPGEWDVRAKTSGYA